MPTEKELRDTRLVWHCSNRYGKECKTPYCRGTSCKQYKPHQGSYHDVIEPIYKYQKKEVK